MLFPVDSFSGGPSLETHKALLLIDLQNDFLKEDGKLFVKNTQEFLHKLPPLVAKFREKGEVFWVNTEFQVPRPMICPDLQSHVIVLEESVHPKTIRAETSPSKAQRTESNLRTTDSSNDGDNPEAFLARRPNSAGFRCCLRNTPGIDLPEAIASIVDHERDSTIIKGDYSAFQAGSLLPTLRKKFVTQLYLCGSLSNISVFATALDAVKHGLEVTIIEDCVGYRLTRCHEEAMRQMADAMGVNGIDYQELLDDLSDRLGDVVTTSTFKSTVGTRQADGNPGSENYSMRVKIKRWMDDLNDDKTAESDHNGPDSTDGDGGPVKRRSLSNRIGVGVASTGKVDIRAQPVPSPRRRNGEGVDEQSCLLNPGTPPSAKTSRIRIRRPRPPSKAVPLEEPASPAIPSKSTIQEARETHTRPQPSADSIEVDGDYNRAEVNAMATMDRAKVLDKSVRSIKSSGRSSRKLYGPADLIGEKDSRIIYTLLPDTDRSQDAFTRLRHEGESCEVRWQKMYHRSGEVPRLVAVQGEALADGSIPIYRHPADESPPLLPFSPMVQEIRVEVEQAVGHAVNHVLMQLYRGGADNISEHSDKTLDIVPGSSIVNVSLGAMRKMTLRTKKSSAATALKDNSHAEMKRTVQRIPLPHNSAFILGQGTNKHWLHAIRADNRQVSEKTAEELAFNGERISLTFRQIGTFVHSGRGTIWGQGATSKIEANANLVLEGGQAEREGKLMIRAFGQENHQSHDFDWEKQYGTGFDVINFSTTEERGKGD
jgi:nicotinamidase-related amidase/alkylated DNA repair dioxygenase AlkB